MLETNSDFVMRPDEHELAHAILEEVGKYAQLGGGGNSNALETEQEREQEQEQQKEVQARRDQQIEVEKFVDRAYERTEESPRSWPISLLARPPSKGSIPDEGRQDRLGEAWSYPLAEFKMLFQKPLDFPSYLRLSYNYFNPNWRGLRRLKNIVMVMEWLPGAKRANSAFEAPRPICYAAIEIVR